LFFKKNKIHHSGPEHKKCPYIYYIPVKKDCKVENTLIITNFQSLLFYRNVIYYINNDAELSILFS